MAELASHLPTAEEIEFRLKKIEEDALLQKKGDISCQEKDEQLTGSPAGSGATKGNATQAKTLFKRLKHKEKQ